MILFLGDSFTWGQGLQYFYKIENEGWTWNDCKNFLEKNNRFETLGFHADEYRRQNSFPYLVSKELNEPLIQPRFENGGDNHNIYTLLDHLHLFVSFNNISTAIIQFSAPTRRLDLEERPTWSVEKIMNEQIERIHQKCEHLGFKWYGISWFQEMGEILQENYSENHIPVLYKGKEFESFDFVKNLELRDLTIQYTQNIDDGHFNKEGHQVIANSILTKIKST